MMLCVMDGNFSECCYLGLRVYNTAVFISARMSSLSVNIQQLPESTAGA